MRRQQTGKILHIGLRRRTAYEKGGGFYDGLLWFVIVLVLLAVVSVALVLVLVLRREELQRRPRDPHRYLQPQLMGRRVDSGRVHAQQRNHHSYRY